MEPQPMHAAKGTIRRDLVIQFTENLIFLRQRGRPDRRSREGMFSLIRRPNRATLPAVGRHL